MLTLPGSVALLTLSGDVTLLTLSGDITLLTLSGDVNAPSHSPVARGSFVVKFQYKTVTESPPRTVVTNKTHGIPAATSRKNVSFQKRIPDMSKLSSFSAQINAQTLGDLASILAVISVNEHIVSKKPPAARSSSQEGTSALALQPRVCSSH